jgi:IS66 Orf2 like protein
MRKQAATLALIVEQTLKRNIFEPALYVFSNERRDRIKIVYWQRNGHPSRSRRTKIVPGRRRAGHCLTAMSISFGSTPAIKLKSRSRCRSGIPAKIACVAIRQSFADRGVTPAHRHRAYKCAALRAASLASGAITIGNWLSTRSQRVNRSGPSAPWRTSCRIGGASQTGSPCSRASESSATSTKLSPRRYAIHTEESTSMSRHRGGLAALGS